jgi:hypothetical protein
MLYSKLGSIPKTDTDGTEGWIEVGYPPNPVADGYEVVWWYPPGWVVRPIKPEGNWSWSQSTEQWIEYSIETITDTIQVGTTNGDTIQVGTTLT